LHFKERGFFSSTSILSRVRIAVYTEKLKLSDRLVAFWLKIPLIFNNWSLYSRHMTSSMFLFHMLENLKIVKIWLSLVVYTLDNMLTLSFSFSAYFIFCTYDTQPIEIRIKLYRVRILELPEIVFFSKGNILEIKRYKKINVSWMYTKFVYNNLWDKQFDYKCLEFPTINITLSERYWKKIIKDTH